MNKIVIIGQGNIGTFVGSTISVSEEVTHLTRNNDKYPKGVVLSYTDRRSKKHRIRKGTLYHYQTTNDLRKISTFNYVIIPVAHYHLRETLASIRQHLVKDQVLIIMGNVWDDFEWLKENISNPYIFAFPNFGGAIVGDSLQGWLTQSLTIGVTNSKFTKQMMEFENILRSTGFRPQIDQDIKGWLMTHFAYNAGMLLEAAKQNGFVIMTKKINSLTNMFRTMKECMNVVSGLGIDVKQFDEGRSVYKAIWCNVIKTYLMFWLPGLAKNADVLKDEEDWISYSRKIWLLASQKEIQVPILNLFHKENN